MLLAWTQAPSPDSQQSRRQITISQLDDSFWPPASHTAQPNPRCWCQAVVDSL